MKTIVLSCLKFYRCFFSPTLTPIFGHGCRFWPTCSDYSLEVINKYGLRQGTVLTLKRLSRCHPFTH